jgi:hypothetical protein
MFTDIAGYTALMGKDEASALELLNLNRKIHKPLIAQYRGKLWKEIARVLFRKPVKPSLVYS